MLPTDERIFISDGAHSARFVDWWAYNVDQRRWLVVRMPAPRRHGGGKDDADDDDDDDDEARSEASRQKASELVTEHVDIMPAGVKRIEIDGEGKVTSTMHVNPEDDWCSGFNNSTYYPLLAEYQLPHDITKTLLRSEITELDRLATHIDLVSYDGREKAVFKYSHNWKGFGPTWQEINIHARLPRHPNILPLDCLVLEEVSGARVVGFTTPFIEGGDLSHNISRPFKLKYLRQLIQVVDDLNYKYGIVHQDISPRNLLIDPATDDLVLFDFNVSARIGQKRETRPFNYGETTVARADRNDVKGVVLTLHEILTRDPRYRADADPPPPLHLLDETDLLVDNDDDGSGAPAGNANTWAPHPDVALDPGLGAADYVAELARWVRARRARPVASWREASAPLDWPLHMRDPPEEQTMYDRAHAKTHGLPFVEWVRPRWVDIDRSRRLLATGKYADEEAGSGHVVMSAAAPALASADGVLAAVQTNGDARANLPGDAVNKSSSSAGAGILTGSEAEKAGRKHTRRRGASRPGRDKKPSRSASSSLAKRTKAKRTVTVPSEGLRRSPRLRGRTPAVYHFG